MRSRRILRLTVNDSWKIFQFAESNYRRGGRSAARAPGCMAASGKQRTVAAPASSATAVVFVPIRVGAIVSARPGFDVIRSVDQSSRRGS